MKKIDLYERERGILLYPNINTDKLSHESPGKSQGSRSTKGSSTNLQYRTNFNPKLQIATSATASEHKAKESTPSNELGALTVTLNYCLNTQSKLANMMEEIGLHLKDLSQENQTSNTASQKQSFVAYSPTKNLSSNSSKDKMTKKASIQLILTRLDGLKKEITSKIVDFEQKMSGFDSANQETCKNSGLNLDEASQNICPRPSPTSQLISLPTKVEEIVSQQKNEQFQMFQLGDRFKSLPHDINKYCIESLNEGSLIRNVFSETPNIKHNPFMQSNGQILQSKARDDKTSDKKELPVSKPKAAASNVQNKSELVKNQSVQKYEKPTASISVENTTNDSINKQPKPSILKDAGPTHTNSMQEDILNQMKPNSVQNQSRTITHDSALNEKNKTVAKESAPVRRRMTSMGSLPANNIVQNTKFTPREAQFNPGRRQNSIKPPLDIIPQKQFADDSLRGNTIDHTNPHEKSDLNASDRTQNMSLHDKSQFPDTQRGCYATEMDEVLQYQTESFIRNTANKEKSIIKGLMKEQYAEESLSYHIANCYKLQIRRCLIHAKWWRAWKDFVNFDADDDAATKSSFFEGSLYPRPGPISNKELICQDSVCDLANLTSELELKENLLEHHDYEAVNKKVYDVLAKWYGSDFEISRVLRPDPFKDNKLCLELYTRRRLAAKTNQRSVDAKVDSNYADMINSIINSNLNAVSPK